MDSNNLLTFGLLALVLVLVIFTFRNSRKRKRDADEMQAKLVPGAEVMTQHGIFGTLISVDDDTNEAVIETTPGTRLRVHRQTLAKVVDPTPEDNEDVVREPSKDELTVKKPAAKPAKAVEATEPQFGERTDDEKPKRAPRKKPTE
jgi:preprotein translocase subunit YajC